MPLLGLKVKKTDRGIIASPVSEYQPDDRTKLRIDQIIKDFTLGTTIMNKPYREFNDKSLIQRQSEDQASFNIYEEGQSSDPDEQWKSNAIRPIVRNRVISIAAHLTAALISPQVFAQNDQDEEDRNSEIIMRDLLEYASEQSNYVKTFLNSVIAALVNPAVILHTEYAEVFRKIKEIMADGKWKVKTILDEILSGFQDSIVPLDELYIGDIYQADIQRQPFLIWRRVINYTLAKSKYGDNQNFNKYVRPGLQIFYDQASATFYEQYDEILESRLVEELIYYNRNDDLELIVVNGVMLTDPDQPNPRKDKKYSFVKGGYEPLDEGKFFYYLSLTRKLAKDEEIVNTLYRMIIDGTYLQLMPPIAIFGKEDINSSVVTPGTVVTLGQGSSIQKIDVGNNLQAGYAALSKVESSISESSQDVLQLGQPPAGQQTAFEISRLEQNARVMLGLFGKMISFMVKDLGELRVSDILQFLTVGQVMEIAGEGSRLRFRTFVMPDRATEGKKKTRKIVLSPEVGKKPPLEESFETMEEEGGPESSMEIWKVNPKIFRNIKFKIVVRPEVTTPMSDALKKALNLELFDRAVQLPFANQEALYRDLLLGSYEQTRDNPDKYMRQEMPGLQSLIARQVETGGRREPTMGLIPARVGALEEEEPMEGGRGEVRAEAGAIPAASVLERVLGRAREPEERMARR